MPGSKIDSAFAIWEINGQKQTVKLQLSNDTLKTAIEQFQEGTGKLTLHLYTAIKFQEQYKSQWFQEKQLSIQHHKVTSINGPTGFHDNHWKPRVLLKDEGNRHVALIGLRPDDPYFLIKNVAANVLRVAVGRDYYNTIGGIRQVGGGEWQCSTGCTDANRNIEDKEFFNFLPMQIGTKPWNHLEIAVVYVTDRWGGGSALSVVHRFQ